MKFIFILQGEAMSHKSISSSEESVTMLVNTTYLAFQNAINKSLHWEVLKKLFTQTNCALKDRRKNKNEWLGSTVNKVTDGVLQGVLIWESSEQSSNNTSANTELSV